MPYHAFIEKRFNRSSLDIIEQADQICCSYADQGYDLSLRQLYYQFIARDAFPNSEQSYNRLGSIISDARQAGLIDWDHIKDRGRSTVSNSHWKHPSDILDACAEQFRIDLWADQPNFVACMVEKQALEGVLEPVCGELDIPFTANKGYASSSLMYEFGRRIAWETQKRDDREAHIVYLGDHDPSGLDMSRDVEDRLTTYSGVDVTVHRVALNIDQVRAMDLIPNPAKLTDSRASGYVAKYGNESWELDAIEPATLARLVRDAVAQLRDDALFNAAMTRMHEHRKKIRAVADNFRAESDR